MKRTSLIFLFCILTGILFFVLTGTLFAELQPKDFIGLWYEVKQEEINLENKMYIYKYGNEIRYFLKTDNYRHQGVIEGSKWDIVLKSSTGDIFSLSQIQSMDPLINNGLSISIEDYTSIIVTQMQREDRLRERIIKDEITELRALIDKR